MVVPRYMLQLKKDLLKILRLWGFLRFTCVYVVPVVTKKELVELA